MGCGVFGATLLPPMWPVPTRIIKTNKQTDTMATVKTDLSPPLEPSSSDIRLLAMTISPTSLCDKHLQVNGGYHKNEGAGPKPTPPSNEILLVVWRRGHRGMSVYDPKRTSRPTNYFRKGPGGTGLLAEILKDAQSLAVTLTCWSPMGLQGIFC